MEDVIFLPFSSLVASMLLYKKYVTSVEIINFISLLGKDNIFISDELDDDLSNLMLCIDYPCDFDYFKLKDSLSFETVLFENVTVRDYLISKSSFDILNCIEKNGYLREETRLSIYNVKRYRKVSNRLM